MDQISVGVDHRQRPVLGRGLEVADLLGSRVAQPPESFEGAETLLLSRARDRLGRRVSEEDV